MHVCHRRPAELTSGYILKREAQKVLLLHWISNVKTPQHHNKAQYCYQINNVNETTTKQSTIAGLAMSTKPQQSRVLLLD